MQDEPLNNDGADNQPSADNSNNTPAPETSEQTVGSALDLFAQEAAGISEGQNPSDNTDGGDNTGAKPPRVARDYSQFQEDERPLFEKMSNDSFNYIAPRWLEAQKVKAEYEKLKQDFENSKGLNFYEQEGAWRLNPEYSELSQRVAQADSEANFWAQQLEAIENGQKWCPLILDATGNVVVGPEQEPSPSARATVIRQMTQANTIKQRFESEVSNYERSFKDKHTAFQGTLKGVEAKIFQGVDQDKLAKMSKSKLEMFPSYLRNRWEYQAIAKLSVLLDAMVYQMKQKRAATNVAAAKNKIASSAGPTNGSLQSSSGPSNKVGNVLDEFHKMKQMA